MWVFSYRTYIFMSKLIIGIDVGYSSSSTYACIMPLNDISKYTVELVYDHTRLPAYMRKKGGRQMFAIGVYNFLKKVLNEEKYGVQDLIVIIEKPFVLNNIYTSLSIASVSGLIEGLCYINSIQFETIVIRTLSSLGRCDAKDKKEHARILAKRHGFANESQDAVDSLMIALMYQHRHLNP